MQIRRGGGGGIRKREKEREGVNNIKQGLANQKLNKHEDIELF